MRNFGGLAVFFSGCVMVSATAHAVSPDLAVTPYLDHDHPTLRETVQAVTRGAVTPREKALRLHDFVRDAIRFGWAPAFYRQKASEVLASRIGYCQTKSTLFVALLRAAGIPARQHFVSIDAAILTGFITPGTRYVDHSYTELMLEGRLLRIDSYIVDTALATAARARLRAEGRALGYGLHIDGETVWDGQRDAFSQFVDNGRVTALSDADYGTLTDVGAFYDRRLGRNRLGWLMRGLFPAVAASANARIARLRAVVEREG